MTTSMEGNGGPLLYRWQAAPSGTHGQRGRISEAFLSELSGFYTWDYESSDPALQRLYELGKRLNWNVSHDIDWTPAVPKDESPHVSASNPYAGYAPHDSMSSERKLEFSWHMHSWLCSQFLHGEQGAFLVASQLVGSAPDLDAKLYAGSQTFDEARHVEVFGRYLRERVGFMYPIDRNLKRLLDQLIVDKRWHLKFIGMQLVVESLALASFQALKLVVRDPVFHAIVEYVSKDEGRHVAFGVNYMRSVVEQLAPQQVEELAAFSFEACVLMRERLVPTDVFAQFGWNVAEAREYILSTALMQTFRTMLFHRIIPNLKRVGLLTSAVRSRYEELGVLMFEHGPHDGLPDDAQGAAAALGALQ